MSIKLKIIMETLIFRRKFTVIIPRIKFKSYLRTVIIFLV